MQSAKVSVLVGTDKSPAHYTTPVELTGNNRNAIRHAAALMAVNVEAGKCALQRKAAPSDKMFDMMLADYRKALASARTTLNRK